MGEQVGKMDEDVTDPPIGDYRKLCSHYSRGCSFVVCRLDYRVLLDVNCPYITYRLHVHSCLALSCVVCLRV